MSILHTQQNATPFKTKYKVFCVCVGCVKNGDTNKLNKLFPQNDYSHVFVFMYCVCITNGRSHGIRQQQQQCGAARRHHQIKGELLTTPKTKSLI